MSSNFTYNVPPPSSGDYLNYRRMSWEGYREGVDAVMDKLEKWANDPYEGADVRKVLHWYANLLERLVEDGEL